MDMETLMLQILYKMQNSWLENNSILLDQCFSYLDCFEETDVPQQFMSEATDYSQLALVGIQAGN